MDNIIIANSHYEYKLQDKLGQGAFGSVYKCLNKENNKYVALKIIDKANVNDSEFQNEFLIMSKLNCENSVNFLEKFEDEKNYYIIMKLYDDNIQSLLDKEQKGFSTFFIKNILFQLNKVFKKMYNFNIIHRDLKPSNFLIEYYDKNDKNKFKIILTDYGLGKLLSNSGKASTKYIGTPLFMAPELEEGEEIDSYNNKIDLWSLGICIYYMKFKNIPKRKFYTGQIPEKFNDNELDDLVMNLIQVDLKKDLDGKNILNILLLKN